MGKTLVLALVLELAFLNQQCTCLSQQGKLTILNVHMATETTTNTDRHVPKRTQLLALPISYPIS